MDGEELQEDLRKVIKQAREWQMTFCIGKCTVMHMRKD